MYFDDTLPARTKLPPANKAGLIRSSYDASVVTCPTKPSPVVPEASADHWNPSHLAMWFTDNVSTLVKYPPAKRCDPLASWSVASANTVLSNTPILDQADPFHLTRRGAVPGPAPEKSPPTMS